MSDDSASCGAWWNWIILIVLQNGAISQLVVEPPPIPLRVSACRKVLYNLNFTTILKCNNRVINWGESEFITTGEHISLYFVPLYNIF